MNPVKRINFTSQFNHEWEKLLDMRFISRIPTTANDFEFVKNELKIKDTDECYVISHYDDVDGKLIDFAHAFDKVYGRGFASILILNGGTKIYLETELAHGKQNRFIGKR